MKQDLTKLFSWKKREFHPDHKDGTERVRQDSEENKVAVNALSHDLVPLG